MRRLISQARAAGATPARWLIACLAIGMPHAAAQQFPAATPPSLFAPPPAAVALPQQMPLAQAGQTSVAASGIERVSGMAPQQEWLGPEPVEPPVYAGPAPAAPNALTQSRLTPPGAKEGMLQRASFTGTWLAGGGSEGLGISTLDARATLAVPIPGVWPPFLVSPGFAVHYLDGPTVSDLPARLYDTGVEFRWLTPINERWTADLAIAPWLYSDFQSGDSRGLRIQGRGIGIYNWSETTKFLLGVVYLDREDVSLLPAAGFMWNSPDGMTKVELLFPRPRVAWALGPPGDAQWWWYVGTEFGGGSYAILRANGTEDVATLRDYRLLLGLERQVTTGLSTRTEIGYVFGREVEYLSDAGNFSPDDTLLLRGGLIY
ncbi:MAG: hypothetical protein K1X74_09740 [Pirellulales bacterium]|nr:hypothetical protein [Pirellulales bacterium]